MGNSAAARSEPPAPSGTETPASKFAELRSLLVGPEQKWLTTTGFLEKVDANLKAALAA